MRSFKLMRVIGVLGCACGRRKFHCGVRLLRRPTRLIRLRARLLLLLH